MWDSSVILVGAAFWDFIIGDPWHWPHPVQLMGWGIARFSGFVLKYIKSPVLQRILGVVLTLILVTGSGAIAWFLLWGIDQSIPVLRIPVEIICLASCFAGRSLRDAAEDVLAPLQRGDLETARSHLSRYVGRETQHLDSPNILRAVLETVSENAVDGVMAPLFYALMGLSLPVIGPVPFAMAYKAASTLDSMVGYRAQPYTYLGWFSAKTDDVLTWIPCRLTVLSLSLLSGKPRQVWQICDRDAPQDPSPNSGWSECAYAACLGVRLGGKNIYRGVTTFKPFVGNDTQPITASVIERALHLTRSCFILWIILTLLIFAAIQHG